MREHSINIKTIVLNINNKFYISSQQLCFIFDFFLVALHLNIIFPEACTKILLLLVYSLVPVLCGVYSIVAMCIVWHTICGYRQRFDLLHRQFVQFNLSLRAHTKLSDKCNWWTLYFQALIWVLFLCTIVRSLYCLFINSS